jgi:hypothetical protein
MMGKEKQKEKDVAVRHQIIMEIDNVREHLKNMRDIFHRGGADDASKTVKSVIDELDLLVQEAEFSEVGHSYPLFSAQKSAHSWDVKKLKKSDLKTIDEVKTVRDACKKLETAVIDRDDTIDPIIELQKIRQFITKTRTDYKQRMNKMKGVK